MTRAAIVSPVRTPVGAFGGALRPLPVEDLGAAVVRELLRRTDLDPSAVDDVVFAQSYANSETPCVGRWIALQAGLPVGVPGMQLDRRCGGGLQSIATAAMMVQTGAADVVIAGGVESMSNIEFYSTDMRSGARAGSRVLHDRLDRGRERAQPEHRFGRISGMIETADTVAARYEITREAANAYAVRSHQRAAQAWTDGIFDDELVPVTVRPRRGSPVIVDRDEGIRTDATPERLASLRPIRPGGVVTAANAYQQNDAAAACLVVAEDRLDDLGMEPFGFLRGWAAAGCEPAQMGLGPVPATEKLFSRLGPTLDDMDLIEVNEAFAPQVLGVLAGWGGRPRGGRRPPKRSRVRHLARSPGRRDRCPDYDDSSLGYAPLRAPARTGTDVHRRRARNGCSLRSGLTARDPGPVPRAWTGPAAPANDPRIGTACVRTVIDDHSRVAYAQIHDEETAVTAIGGSSGWWPGSPPAA